MAMPSLVGFRRSFHTAMLETTRVFAFYPAIKGRHARRHAVIEKRIGALFQSFYGEIDNAHKYILFCCAQNSGGSCLLKKQERIYMVGCFDATLCQWRARGSV
tara:strand:+ start:441 stop:749 length:309 start_codon:yes stop_codon:yes gene_type:complete